MHADCEEALLRNGSMQEDIWGGNWYPEDATVEFDSFINIRPREGNRSMTIQDPRKQALFEEITREVFEGTDAGSADRVRDKRLRYCADPVPVRLGNLATSLNRLASCALKPSRDRLTGDLIVECRSFMEWVEPEADPRIRPSLMRIREALLEQGERWSKEDRDDLQRLELSEFAREQSEQVLEWSGLLAAM